MTANDDPGSMPLVGWREWIDLPDLGIRHLKAKIDTGARTSALHARDLREIEVEGRSFVEFTAFPRQGTDEGAIRCTAPLVDRRQVRSSSGQARIRPVVRTTIRIGPVAFPIELTLAGRDRMGFRMLIGRTALRRRFLVDPGRSFVHPAPPTEPSQP